MSLAVVYSRAALGIEAPLVTVEVHLLPGLPGLAIVGLPEAAVKESKERVKSAIINSHFDFPDRKIIINLAPADLPKEGGRYDLPIAIGILAASQQIPFSTLQNYEFAGELALSGELRPILKTLTLALGSRASKRALILPLQNAEEAALPGDNLVYGANHLSEVYAHLIKKEDLIQTRTSETLFSKFKKRDTSELDLGDVKGQILAKRALEISAAGGHSLLMIGPPGTGKTMLAQRLPKLLPPLSLEQTLEVLALYSLSNEKTFNLEWGKRPFRSPHHTISSVALVGGGSIPKPGEISLAHHGVLFLDELPEFERRVLEVLREPLESGSILISRAIRKTEFPAKFQLLAAMNPCPCGYLRSPQGSCRCTEEQVKRYLGRLSGPLLDRIDMHIEVLAQAASVYDQDNHASDQQEQTLKIIQRIESAQKKQMQRSRKLNAELNNAELLQNLKLSKKAKQLALQATEKFNLSARSYYRILRVAKTISDLEGTEEIQKDEIAEALSLRTLDRLNIR